MEIDEIPVGRAKNIKGQKFGRLTVLYRVNPPDHVTTKDKAYWKCKCECGNEIITTTSQLTLGQSKSCGCLRKENNANFKPILPGTRFGKLTVIKQVENIGKYTAYLCQCDCGNTTIVRASSLRRNKKGTKSCGCLHKRPKSTRDLTGQKFGRLTVLEKVLKEEGRSEWKCQCDCGNIINVLQNSLITGNTKSCGCLNKESPACYIDETGNRYGRLVVLERDTDYISPQGKKQVRWKCQCDCGNIITVKAEGLRNGHTQSCGCYRKEFHAKAHTKDLTNQRFGRLIAIKPLYMKNNYWYWLCQCDCGNTHVTSSHNLLSGGCQSCGCLKSKGESKIQSILTTNNIKFIKEKYFKNCKSSEGTLLRFDFYVTDKYLIEYDGQHHFYDIDYFGGKAKFKTQQERDKIKNEYCKSHNIPLIRIPYWHYDKITIDDLRPETSQFLI